VRRLPYHLSQSHPHGTHQLIRASTLQHSTSWPPSPTSVLGSGRKGAVRRSGRKRRHGTDLVPQVLSPEIVGPDFRVCIRVVSIHVLVLDDRRTIVVGELTLNSLDVAHAATAACQRPLPHLTPHWGALGHFSAPFPHLSASCAEMQERFSAHTSAWRARHGSQPAR
jgi:hypothetical protein